MSRTEQFAVGVALIGTALSIILQRDFLAYLVLILGVAIVCNSWIQDLVFGKYRPTWKEIQDIPAERYGNMISSRKFTRWVEYRTPASKMRYGLKAVFVVVILGGLLLFGSFAYSHRNDYEVLERTEKTVPDFQGTGTHTAINYVLLHNGRTIATTCDWEDVGNIDPKAACGFRPLRTYQCRLGDLNRIPLSDLQCTDAEGRNVYLYVDKVDAK